MSNLSNDQERHVLRLFEEAAQIPPEKHGSFLDERCGNAPELRAAVEDLLRRELPEDFLSGTPELSHEETLSPAFATDAEAPRLNAGDRLEDFVIEERLGAGGMGEVYRARDTRLRRSVAIKVLSPPVAGDRQLRKRFLREARAISRLTHPRICTLYDAREDDGIDFLVMELLVGETLSSELKSGRLPVDRALETAVEIAEALEHAHTEGVVHRDLKPGNIMRIQSGIKVLDFGIAKTFRRPSAPEDTAGSADGEPTTTAGLVLGTLAYMSPQQLRGQAVDAQADIWAFGCVLYELLTGRGAFGGETPTDVLAAVIERDPDWSRLPAKTPRGVRRLLRRCLEKDPRRRLRDIGDARLELEECLSDEPLAEEASASEASRDRRSVVRAAVLAAAISVVVTVLAAFLLLDPSKTPSASTPLHVSLILPPGMAFDRGESAPVAIARRPLAISPDGMLVVYAASGMGTPRLVRRDLSGFESTEIPGTDGAYHPFFSPDGREIAYFTDRGLHRVSLLGGKPILLCDAVNAFGGSWGEDGSIVYANLDGRELLRVDAEEGSRRQIHPVPDIAELSPLGWPQHLPGSAEVLVSSRDETIRVISLESGEWTILSGLTGTAPSYLPSGYIVCTRAGDLYAAAFDVTTKRVTGSTSPPLLSGVRTGGYGAGQYALSATGTIAFVPGGLIDQGRLVWRKCDPAATDVEVAWDEIQSYGEFRFSPDQTRVAVTIDRPDAQVWVADVSSTPWRWSRIVEQGGRAVWSRDGTYLYFCREGAEIGIYRTRAEPGAPVETVKKFPSRTIPYAIAPDGVLIVGKDNAEGKFSLFKLDLETREVTPFISWAWGPTFSPDGQWVVYTKGEGQGVRIAPSLEPSRESMVSGEGEEPIWSGDKIFYRDRGQWFVVRVSTRPQLEIGRPSVVVPEAYVQVQGFSYDYHAASDRFLMIQSVEPDATEIQVITDWGREVTAMMDRTDRR